VGAFERSLWVAVRIGVSLGVGLACCARVFALDPSLDINQYAHTAWKIREGFAKGYAEAIAQTPDGYLWFGTQFGLLRFDGVKAVPWQPPAGEDLPNSEIRGLLVARDGALWIGTRTGLASWKDGKLARYPELAGQDVYSLLQDREGTIWVGGLARPTGRLCEIRGARVKCVGEDGRFGIGVWAPYEDRRGNLWAGGRDGLWRWKPGPAKLYSMPGPLPQLYTLGEGDNGEPLIATRGGIRHFVEGKIEPYPLLGTAQGAVARRLLRDRDGGLWIGTMNRGLVHLHRGMTDEFARSDGLSGDSIVDLFEDREGNIWISTEDGFDRFRDFAVATISANQGLPSAWSVLAARDGSVWFGSSNGLYRWNGGGMTVYRRRTRPLSSAVERPPPRLNRPGTVREITDSELPDDVVQSLGQDDRGRLWVTTRGGVAWFEDGRFHRGSGLPGGEFYSITADGAGNVWMANEKEGLFHLVRGTIVEKIPWSVFGPNRFASILLSDAAKGGVWLGFTQGGIAHYFGGQVRASYDVSDGLGMGVVGSLRLDQDGALWAATKGGLSRVKNGRVATLNGKNGLPCDSVHWETDDDAHSVWLETACGLVRIARAELDGWVDDPRRRIQVAVFDSSDGIRSHPLPSSYSPRVAKSSDGRLWFPPWDGISFIDPRHLLFNRLPPPVHIEQIIADRQAYAPSSHLRLPPLVRDLTIDYTALNLVAPEKVRFRFKLEGQDRAWREVANIRQVQYSNLAPGSYRFRVTACNNSGVWNEQGATLDFSIAPAYWQTRWFVALCVAAFMALLWALYQLRLRQLARQFNMTLEARVGERTRIARELHDTLLQSFHGLLLRFQAISNRVQPGQIKEQLDSAINEAAEAITEGRDAVQELRASVVETKDLAVALRTLGEELAADQAGDGSVVLDVMVEGAPRALHPIVRDEIYRIACEAMRNAFRHADATRIEVGLRYDERQFRVRVRDDGKGIDPKFLAGEERAGHFGLHGMRERTRLIGGKLTVWTAVDFGTEAELIIPASRAYAGSPSERRSWFIKQLSGKIAQIDS